MPPKKFLSGIKCVVTVRGRELILDTVNVTLNFMGAPVAEGFVKAVKNGDIDPKTSLDYILAESVLGLPVNSLPEEVIERYSSVSTKELYVPFLPHTEKIFGRLLLPFKSAKRCYCLGEFLATIELCAHIGEMLAQLVWDMESIFKAEKDREDELEKAFFGSSFEKLGQERRVRILYSSHRVTEEQRNSFDELRTTRRKYFHLWNEPVEHVEKDAKKCFENANSLIHGILQINISEIEPGKLVVNPRLSQYLDRVHAENE